MWELAEFKNVSLIKLSDGSTIQTDKSPDEILRVVNSGVKFVKISGKVVNINAIRTIEIKEWDEISDFLLGITDEVVKDRMKAILEERKNKWLKTNWVKHLIQIYTDRHGEFGG